MASMKPIQVTFTLQGENGRTFNLNESSWFNLDDLTDITFESPKVDKRKYNKGIDFYRK